MFFPLRHGYEGQVPLRYNSTITKPALRGTSPTSATTRPSTSHSYEGQVPLPLQLNHHQAIATRDKSHFRYNSTINEPWLRGTSPTPLQLDHQRAIATRDKSHSEPISVKSSKPKTKPTTTREAGSKHGMSVQAKYVWLTKAGSSTVWIVIRSSGE